MKFFLRVIFLVMFLTAIGVSTNAQLPLDVSLIITPTSPAPGEIMTARAVLINGDPQQAIFQWFVNGTAATTVSGKGRDSYSFSFGKDARLTIDVAVTAHDGKRASATRAITREAPVIVWWADTFIPYWYKGKAIPSPESTVTVFAVPGAGFGEPSSALRYSWTVGGESRPEVSGVGKNSFTLTVSRAVNIAHQITVKISNSNQTISQESTAIIPTRQAETLVYRLSPAGWIDTSQPLSAFEGNAGDVHDFIAYPFFFKLTAIPNLIYQWQINEQTIEGAFDRPNVLTLRTRQGEKSANNIRISIKEPEQNLRNAETAFTANFR